jgi:hypothetical protein
MAGIFDEQEANYIEELLENSMETYFNSPFMDINFSDDLLLNTPPLSEELPPPINPTENSSTDIRTDIREWLITDKNSNRQRPPRLYEFLILLLKKEHYASYASYKDKSQGIFEVHQPEKVANLWQQVTNRQSHNRMTYDKFARAIRWYYKDDIMKKTNTRHTFQFSPKTLQACINDENNNTIIDYPM